MQTLSTDPILLQALLKEQQRQNQQLQSQLQTQSQLIEKLQQQLAQFQQMLFGQRSERQSSKKKSTQDKKTGQSDSSGSSDKKTNKNGRRRLPDDLPRQTIEHDLPEDEKNCPCCQFTLRRIGQETTEQLDFIPAQLMVKEHVRYKYACSHCQGHVVTAPLPAQPIDKGLAGAGLLAQVLVNKYDDALPLYRQQRRWQRLGYDLPISTLCDWVMQCANRLNPIVEAMTKTCLLPSKKIHTDDTTVPVLAKGKTHTGRLWVYIGGGENAPPCTIYQYSKTRAQTVPQQFLKGYQGYLQADAYPGYNVLYKDKTVIEVGCWAHARRKFADIVKTIEEPGLAVQAIESIAQLYAVEKSCQSMTLQQRYYYRRHYAKPLLKRFHRWLKHYHKTAPPQSPLGKAITYALNQWQALNNYLRNGILDIDNNRAERAIRPLVIGRKNYLFAGSHSGAQAAATIYSLIESCKMLNINTFDYFRDVLQRLPTTLNKNIADLFPCHWRPLTT